MVATATCGRKHDAARRRQKVPECLLPKTASVLCSDATLLASNSSLEPASSSASALLPINRVQPLFQQYMQLPGFQRLAEHQIALSLRLLQFCRGELAADHCTACFRTTAK